MLLNCRTPLLRLARLLAFAALLCVTALQAEEAGHWHAGGDGVAQCLLCKGSAGTAVVSLEYTCSGSTDAAPAPAAAESGTPATRFIHILARGPPVFS